MHRQIDHWRKLPRAALVVALSAAGLMFGGCRGIVSPHGSNADRLANLWWVTFGISAILFVVIVAMLLYALFRPRDGTPSMFENRPRAATMFIIVSGAVIPVIILTGVFAYTVQISAANTEAKPDALRVEAIGHDFYWEFVYPDENIRTINTLHIPVDRPVDLTVTSVDVIHSFWVPELNGKLDALPGITNQMTFSANSVGEYRGRCAEFCGKGHVCMDFATVAEEQTQFHDWVSTIEQQTFRLPDADAVQYMLDQCFNHQNYPVCMPVGCPPGAKPSGSVRIEPSESYPMQQAG